MTYKLIMKMLVKHRNISDSFRRTGIWLVTRISFL